MYVYSILNHMHGRLGQFDLYIKQNNYVENKEDKRWCCC
jgi:hypothetical protein